MIKMGIYAITATNGKVYVGGTTNMKKRWSRHKGMTYKGNNHLNNSFREFGVDKHSFKILEECERNILEEREIFWKTQYLSEVGGDMTQVLFHYVNDGKILTEHSKATKKRISESMQIAKANSTYSATDDVERNSKISKAMLGVKRSDEVKRKLSRPHIWNYKRVAQYTKDGVFIAEFESIKAAAAAVGGNNGAISTALKGFNKRSKIHTAYGYKWRYVDE